MGSASSPLVGIARLASNGNLLDAKRRVEYRSLPTRNWLNRCSSQRVPFQWTINPYRGCEYGCPYCYARYAHEFLERREVAAFETEIYAKDLNLASFRKELHQLRPGESIGIGTATDPYQPAERKFGRTRSLLECLTGIRGMSIYITTKSDLIVRDADLLRELGARNSVHISISLISVDNCLARLLDPFAPRPDLRLEALAGLASNGISAGVLASPVLPLLTDSHQNLLAVAKAAKAAGARSFSAGILFLQPAARRVFFDFLAGHFPDHVQRYRANYGSGAYVRGRYPELLRRRIERVKAEAGFNGGGLNFDTLPTLIQAQMSLF